MIYKIRFETTIIIKNELDRKECTSPYGNRTFELSKEEIYALLAGETLGKNSPENTFDSKMMAGAIPSLKLDTSWKINGWMSRSSFQEEK